jgi:putative membrane protein
MILLGDEYLGHIREIRDLLLRGYLIVASVLGSLRVGAHHVNDEDLANEKEPDARFTYANERTFLAWNRTALALIATGVAATQLLPEFHVDGGRRILGLPMIALGALVAVTSCLHWKANERAMRRGQPLPRSPMPLVLSIGVGLVAVIAVVLALIGSR